MDRNIQIQFCTRVCSRLNVELYHRKCFIAESFKCMRLVINNNNCARGGLSTYLVKLVFTIYNTMYVNYFNADKCDRFVLFHFCMRNVDGIHFQSFHDESRIKSERLYLIFFISLFSNSKSNCAQKQKRSNPQKTAFFECLE